MNAAGAKKVFHSMEKVFADFPHNGKNVSTLWKTFGRGEGGMKTILNMAMVCVLGCAGAVQAATVTNVYSYDAAGRLERADYGGGARIDYVYDAGGNLVVRTARVSAAETVATPGFSPDGGSHAGSSVTVTVTCATADATIRYTTNGSEPMETNSIVVSGAAVAVPVPGTLKAKAWKAGMEASATKTGTWTRADAQAWESGFQDLGGGWRRLGWFGDYAPMGPEGWIWHNKHGFFYAAAGSTASDIWFFANDMGWLYTGNALYPFLYRSNDGAWLWYNGATNPRWFMNFTSGQWENRP